MGVVYEEPALSELFVIVVLMVLNGLFAGAEIAVLSVRKTRLAELVDEGVWGAGAVHWLRQEPERFLATVQIGITVVSTTAAAFGGERFAGAAGHWLSARLPWLGTYAWLAGFFTVVGVLSFAGIIVGELVPKSLALRSAERYSLLVGPALRTMASLVKPLVWMLTRSSNTVLAFFGDSTSFTEARLSPDELQELVEEAARVGSLDPKTSEMTSRALEFRDRTVLEVMVPRGDIVALARDATARELRDVLVEGRYTRLPVYENEIDNVVGYVALKDVVGALIDGTFSLEAVLRPVQFVPSTMKAVDLLRQLQSQHNHIVMVVDESGGLQGLVTIDDLVEEVMGDIWTEPDSLQLQRDPDGSLQLAGSMPLHDANRVLGFELPTHEGFTTLAGLALHLAQRIPEAGAKLPLPDGALLEIVEATKRRVHKVRVHPPKPVAPEEPKA